MACLAPGARGAAPGWMGGKGSDEDIVGVSPGPGPGFGKVELLDLGASGGALARGAGSLGGPYGCLLVGVPAISITKGFKTQQ
jgi:hypothetical protein